MNKKTTYVGVASLVVIASIAYLYFSSGYGKTTKLGYEFAQALYSACNQKDLERVQKVELLVNEYAGKQKIKANEKRWLADIIQLAHDGKWEKAQQNARKLLKRLKGLVNRILTHGCGNIFPQW